MHENPSETTASSSPKWNRRSATTALLLILGMGVLAGVLALRSRANWRARCLAEYALARTAADTARVDLEGFRAGRGGRTYCRSFRQPLPPLR
jgi:hypothetical protein